MTQTIFDYIASNSPLLEWTPSIGNHSASQLSADYFFKSPPSLNHLSKLVRRFYRSDNYSEVLDARKSNGVHSRRFARDGYSDRTLSIKLVSLKEKDLFKVRVTEHFSPKAS